MKKIRLLAVSMALVAGAAGLVACGKQPASKEEKVDFPKKTIQMTVPFATGGTTDIAARALAGVVSKYLPNGQSVVVVNKPGSGGAIGMTEIFKAAPDGYTIGMATVGPMTIVPHYGKVAYSIDGFKAVMRVVATPNILVVKKDAPWNTFEEWFDYVKKNPDKFTYGTSGAGLTQHITMESFNVATGVKTKHVPFEGGAPALTALLGGHVQGALVQSTEAKPHIDSGAMKALVNTGATKIEAFKDVPTLKDKGIDVAADVWNGIVVPKDVPDSVVKILHDAFKKALEDPAVVEQFKKIGIDPAYAGPQEFQKIIENDFKKNGEVLKASGLIK